MINKDWPFIHTVLKQISFLMAVFFITACQVETKHEEKIESKPLVDPKYSLAQDRTEYDQLRNSIPETTRKINDEKALLAEWMLGYQLPPAKIREKYESLIRKKRELFNKDLKKLREDFSKNEINKRANILKEIAAERSNFASKKKTQQERNEFYNELDGKRKNHFSEEREKRDEFEASMRDQRKNFEDYLNEKRLDFANTLKAYTETWSTKQKEDSKK